MLKYINVQLYLESLFHFGQAYTIDCSCYTCLEKKSRLYWKYFFYFLSWDRTILSINSQFKWYLLFSSDVTGTPLSRVHEYIGLGFPFALHSMKALGGDPNTATFDGCSIITGPFWTYFSFIFPWPYAKMKYNNVTGIITIYHLFERRHCEKWRWKELTARNDVWMT